MSLAIVLTIVKHAAPINYLHSMHNIADFRITLKTVGADCYIRVCEPVERKNITGLPSTTILFFLCCNKTKVKADFGKRPSKRWQSFSLYLFGYWEGKSGLSVLDKLKAA